MESCYFEEGPCPLPEEHQKFTIVDLAITVQVSLIDHFLDVQLI
jgi:hypothetical protein